MTPQEFHQHEGSFFGLFKAIALDEIENVKKLI